MGFGVPPYAHDDDPVRGVQCALAMDQLLHSERVGGRAFGITTGDVFCGSIGNERRAEYGMVGSKVVLAARLMVAALKGDKSRGSIIVDADTYSTASEQIPFELDLNGQDQMEPIKVKGREEPVETYRPRKEESVFRKKASNIKLPEPHRPVGEELGAVSSSGSIDSNTRDNEPQAAAQGARLARPTAKRGQKFSSAAAANLIQRQSAIRAEFDDFSVRGVGGGGGGGSFADKSFPRSANNQQILLKGKSKGWANAAKAAEFYMWPMFGRDVEVRRIQTALDDFVEEHLVDSELWRDGGGGGGGAAIRPAGPGAVMLIEGPAGIGKTSMMKRTLDLAHRNGFCVIEVTFSNISGRGVSGGGGGGGGGFTPWFKMMDALHTEIDRLKSNGTAPAGMDAFPKDQKQRLNLMRMQGLTLQAASAFMSIDSDVVDALYDELHSCVVWLVYEVMKHVPVALFVEDAGFLGIEGMAMMHSLVAQNNLPGLMLVMALNPQHLSRIAGCDEIIDAMRGLAASNDDDGGGGAAAGGLKVGGGRRSGGGGGKKGSAHLPLGGLDESATESVLLHFGRTEGVRSVEPRVLKFIHERSRGNPWHAKEWMFDRLKLEVLEIHGGEDPRTSMVTTSGGTTAPRKSGLAQSPRMSAGQGYRPGELHVKDVGKLLRAQLPYSVRSSFTSMLDKLDEDDLIALRVSAVLGEVSSNLLDAVKIAIAPARLADSLPNLVKSGFLVPVPPELSDILACYASGHCAKKFGVPFEAEEYKYTTVGSSSGNGNETVYRFASLAMQEVAYGSWSLDHRAEVHERAIELTTNILRRLDELSRECGVDSFLLRNQKELQAATPRVRVECYAKLVHHRCMGENYDAAVELHDEYDHAVASVTGERKTPLLDFCMEQVEQVFGAEHLDPVKHGSNWRMEHAYLVPHVRGVAMVREMKTKKRFAKLRGVLHLGGFRRMNQKEKENVGGGSEPSTVAAA